MAEKQAAEYDQVVQDLSGLLANEAVPVNVIDIERKDASKLILFLLLLPSPPPFFSPTDTFSGLF